MFNLLIGLGVEILLLTGIRFASPGCPSRAAVFLCRRRPLRGGPNQILVRTLKEVLVRRDGDIFGDVASEVLNLVVFAHTHCTIQIVSRPTSALTLRDVFRDDRTVSLWVSCDTRGGRSCIEDNDGMTVRIARRVFLWTGMRFGLPVPGVFTGRESEFVLKNIAKRSFHRI
jgi:hypothetical protein